MLFPLSEVCDFFPVFFFLVTFMALQRHGYSSSCSARQMMASAYSRNDHSQTKAQHMPANDTLRADYQAIMAKFLIGEERFPGKQQV